MNKSVDIHAASSPIYPGSIAEELDRFIHAHSYSRLVILADTHTSEKCIPLLKETAISNADIIEIDAGEENKNIDICIGIWSMMNDFEIDRHSLLINLGGGMIMDIGGFAASVYKRGIDFVHIPTSLLGMVDASIGGKTGIDMNQLKNQIGTFTQAKAVFIDPVFLQTLPEREMQAGYAEMIKHALIADAGYFRQIKKNLFSTHPDILLSLIEQSIGIKNKIVSQDPYEQGLRKLLNFGHTIGHAIESYSLANDEFPLNHGEAIAIGMCCEARLSFTKNSLAEKEMNEIIDLIYRHYPSYQIEESEFDIFIQFMKNDKKNKSGQICFSLLKHIGAAGYNCVCNEEELTEALRYYNNLNK